MNHWTVDCVHICYKKKHDHLIKHILWYNIISLPCKPKDDNGKKFIFEKKANKKLSLVGACRGYWNSNEGILITRRLLIKVFEGNMCRIMQLSRPTQLRQNYIFWHCRPLVCKVMICKGHEKLDHVNVVAYMLGKDNEEHHNIYVTELAMWTWYICYFLHTMW